jgi:hypothetical protein
MRGVLVGVPGCSRTEAAGLAEAAQSGLERYWPRRACGGPVFVAARPRA